MSEVAAVARAFGAAPGGTTCARVPSVHERRAVQPQIEIYFHAAADERIAPGGRDSRALQQAIDGDDYPLVVQAVAQKDADGLARLQSGALALGAIGGAEDELIPDRSGEPKLGDRQVGIEVHPNVERGAFAALTALGLHQCDRARCGECQRGSNEHRLARTAQAHRPSI